MFLFRSLGLLNRGPESPLCWVLAFSTTSCHQRVWSPKLTDFLSSSSYIIVQSPTQYLPITGHRNVSLPLSLEWHVWLSSSGNNCHAVHRSLSSGASVCGCTAGFYLVPYCQPSPLTRFLPITGHWNVSLPLSLEWHVWPVEGQYKTEGAIPFSGLLHFTLVTHFIMLSVKQGGIKYHFFSLWYNSTYDWTLVAGPLANTLPTRPMSRYKT